MKTFKYFLSVMLFVVAVMACTKEEFGSDDFVSSVVAPANVTAFFTVTQDNTGTVTITPNSEGAVKYDLYLGDGTADPVKIEQGKNLTHVYAEGTYEVKLVAYGITGLKTESTDQLVVSFKAPENVVVEIENDAAISKRVNVKVTADYATMFEVYFGEEGNDEPVGANIGDIASYVYQEAGTYTIKVVAKSAAIETVEVVQEFEVTAILQPLVKAPRPVSREEADVVSIFSDAYTNVVVTEWNPGWGQSTVLTPFDVDGDNILKYDYLNYTGIVTDYANPTDVSAMEYVHFDYWTNDAETIGFKIVNTSYDAGNPLKEFEVTNTVTEVGKWVSVDIPLSDFTTDMSGVTQMLFVSNGVTVFIDNLYFWKEPSTVVVPIIFDDFDANRGITTWAGDDCGMNDAFANPFKTGINTSDKVLEYNDGGGTYANVRFDIAPSNFKVSAKNTFSLKIYVPSSTSEGSSSQISLKLQDGTAGEPWTTQTEIIKPIVFDQWQTVTFDFVNDDYVNWSTVTTAPADRTDLNRVVLQVNGEGNNNKVIAYIDDFSYGVDDSGSGTPPFDGGLVTNGDFQSGASPWIIGVGTDPAPVVTEGGNTYYSVNVSAAGNPWDVNVSQKLEIINGATYTLTFDAWSNVNRPIIAGIGLSADPWSNTVETVNITTSKQTYTRTLTADFGAANARVLFDLGAAAGTVNIDNVSLVNNDGGGTPPPSSGTQIDLPVDFESTTVDYTLTDFGGNASSLVADPTNASNTVAKAIKTDAAEFWAGTTIGTDNGFATNIPITLTNSKMTVRVWSPDAGTPIRLKIEDANDKTHTCETEVNTTVAGGWETLTFDFTNQAPGTELLSVGLSNGWVYNKASIFFNFGTDGATAGEKTYYFDDVLFVQ